MTMCATVIGIEDYGLLVVDNTTEQEVLVKTRCKNNFAEGERVKIFYNGIMTFSLPPQINADRIVKACNKKPDFFK